MEVKKQSIYASIIILLVGIWVAISPIWLAMTGGALTSVIVTGVIMALAGLTQLFWEIPLPSWFSGLAAVWLFISAFAFSNSNGAMWSEILSGIAVFLLSYWDGFEIAQLQEQHKTHTAMR